MGDKFMNITFENLGANLVDLAHSGYLQLLLWAILIDVITGYAKAFKNKKYNSTIGINGMIRHFLVVLIVCVAGVYTRAIDMTNISTGLALFFSANYGLSIIENCGELGITLPTWIRAFFVKLKDENDKGMKK